MKTWKGWATFSTGLILHTAVAANLPTKHVEILVPLVFVRVSGRDKIATIRWHFGGIRDIARRKGERDRRSRAVSQRGGRAWGNGGINLRYGCGG